MFIIHLHTKFTTPQSNSPYLQAKYRCHTFCTKTDTMEDESCKLLRNYPPLMESQQPPLDPTLSEIH